MVNVKVNLIEVSSRYGHCLSKLDLIAQDMVNAAEKWIDIAQDMATVQVDFIQVA
jgi:hypothetical protein